MNRPNKFTLMLSDLERAELAELAEIARVDASSWLRARIRDAYKARVISADDARADEERRTT